MLLFLNTRNIYGSSFIKEKYLHKYRVLYFSFNIYLHIKSLCVCNYTKLFLVLILIIQSN